MNVSTRPASTDDIALINNIAFVSKAHGRFSTGFMEACRDELTYSAENLINPNTHLNVQTETTFTQREPVASFREYARAGYVPDFSGKLEHIDWHRK